VESSKSTHITEIVKQLTLDEKISLLAGKNFWETVAIERLGIPSIFMTDGPHGLRKARGEAITDLTDSVPATCFPTASGLASTWNPELITRVGEALGRESKANNVQVLLGPGVNIKRSPLGGRNFEYFSEDPILAGALAVAYIRGVQSQGVGTSLKHFALNSQETERFTSSSDPDERTYRELYLYAFEKAVREAQPWSLMVAYNKIHGIPATENEDLLHTILRDTWGYQGIALSDWGAVNHRAAALNAGLQLQMPGPGGRNSKELLEAVQDGSLKKSVIDEAVTTLLEGIFHVAASTDPHASYDHHVHHNLAAEAAQEAAVLLRNERSVLPLTPSAHPVAIIGEFAKHPRYQGAGSSQVNASQLDIFYDAFLEYYGNHSHIHYAAGYRHDGSTTQTLIDEALHTARNAEYVIIVAGLPPSVESEGFDRTSIDMPAGHNELIAALAALGKKTIVALQNGSVVTMPWINSVDAVIECWLGGQAGGTALARVITGAVNPSGKLSETIPHRIEDTPAFPFFPSKSGSARYEEGLFVGYRWYDKRDITPLFPFGYGLSYTSFSYTDLHLSSRALVDTDNLTVSLIVANTGHRPGKTTVQVYIGDETGAVLTPVRQLKAFQKIELSPGESRHIDLSLTPRDFAFYDTTLHDFRVPAGKFTIYVGDSSVNLPLTSQVTVANVVPYLPLVDETSPLRVLKDHPRGRNFYEMIANNVPEGLRAFVDEMPVGKLSMMAGDLLSPSTIEKIIHHTNTPGSVDPMFIPEKLAKFAHWYHQKTHQRSHRK